MLVGKVIDFPLSIRMYVLFQINDVTLVIDYLKMHTIQSLDTEESSYYDNIF